MALSVVAQFSSETTGTRSRSPSEGVGSSWMALSLISLVLVSFLSIAFAVDGEIVMTAIGAVVTAILAWSAVREYQEQISVPRRSVSIASIAAGLMIVGAVLYGITDAGFGAWLSAIGLVTAIVALWVGRSGWVRAEDHRRPA